MAKTIQTLIQEQEDLTKAMQEATTQRTAEKTENKATISDAQAGAAAVKSALVVLRNFYDSQSFIQKQAPEMEAYGGMQAGKGGVVGMLEVIVSDFVRLEAETKSAEAMGAAEYDGFMKDAEANEELAKANDYFEVLKPECIEVKVSYEERVKARQDEIDALKEAYKTLDSKSVEW